MLLTVRSGKRMRPDGLPNIRRVSQTEAAAHSLLTVKPLGAQFFWGLKVEKMVGVLPIDDCGCIGTLLKSCRWAVFVCSRLRLTHLKMVNQDDLINGQDVPTTSVSVSPRNYCDAFGTLSLDCCYSSSSRMCKTIQRDQVPKLLLEKCTLAAHFCLLLIAKGPNYGR